jgi:hypothetical protein
MRRIKIAVVASIATAFLLYIAAVANTYAASTTWKTCHQVRTPISTYTHVKAQADGKFYCGAARMQIRNYEKNAACLGYTSRCSVLLTKAISGVTPRVVMSCATTRADGYLKTLCAIPERPGYTWHFRFMEKDLQTRTCWFENADNLRLHTSGLLCGAARHVALSCITSTPGTCVVDGVRWDCTSPPAPPNDQYAFTVRCVSSRGVIDTTFAE